MAIYVGFFDAAFVEELGGYDRVYDSGDFVEYFGQFIGSGVCLYNNENSMLVNVDSSAKRVLINPGYLFINGYWLKSTELYAMSTAGWAAGTYAIMATLSMGNRSIVLGYANKVEPEVYPDSLVLAYVTIGAGGTMSVVDTRSNTDICGTIDSAGSLSNKVEMALQYIDTEVDGKLDQALATMSATEANLNSMLADVDTELNGKLEEANGMIAAIAPPAIGTIKFSASRDIEEGWLRCDGSYVTETQYPDLVAALGKLAPSGDKFSVLNDSIGPSITNAVEYDGKIWVYSYSTQKLYGVDVDGGEMQEINVTCSNSKFLNLFQPSPTMPLVLSIVPHIGGTGARLFLAQYIAIGSLVSTAEIPEIDVTGKLLVFGAEFNSGASIDVSLEFDKVDTSYSLGTPSKKYYAAVTFGASGNDNAVRIIPYIVSKLVDGVEQYCMLCGKHNYNNDYCVGMAYWNANNNGVANIEGITLGYTASGHYGNYYNSHQYQAIGFSPNNKNEAVAVGVDTDDSCRIQNYSQPSGRFSGNVIYNVAQVVTTNVRTATLPLAIASDKAVVFNIQLGLFTVVRLDEQSAKHVKHNLPLPASATLFYDAGCYLFGKDIYMIFVGTGILFFRDFETDAVGYLDTTSVLGTISQFGQLLHSADDNALYIIGQDTTGKVKVAKMVLNTLFDYATDGAWLPSVESDGVPAFIKAFDTTPPGPSNSVKFSGLYTDKSSISGKLPLDSLFRVTLNGEAVVSSTNEVLLTNPVVLRMEALMDYTNNTDKTLSYGIYLGTNTEFDYITTSSRVTWEANASIAKTILVGGTIREGDSVEVTVDLSDYAKRMAQGQEYKDDVWISVKKPATFWLKYNTSQY